MSRSILTTLPVVLALALAGCLDQSHGANGAAPDVGDLPCVTCHLATYNTQVAADGAHPKDTNCQNCHNTTNWMPAHPENPFPIKVGNHAGIACNQCHITSRGAAYKTNFDCYGNGACHATQHDNPNHDPQLCFSCHPTGSAGDGGGG